MTTPEFLLGIHNFKGRSEDELDITRGDYIEVIEDDSEFNDSWYFGRNLTTNISGLFPKSFTTAVVGLPPDVQRRKAEFDAMLDADPTRQSAVNADVGQGFEESGNLGTQPVGLSPELPVQAQRQQSNAQGGQGEYSNIGHPDGLGQKSNRNNEVSNESTFQRQGQAISQSQNSRDQYVPEQPSLSKLSLQDSSSPSTDRSVANASGPNSASSTEPVFDMSAQNGYVETKNYIYQNQNPQMSQGSNIDAAISAMQSGSPLQDEPINHFHPPAATQPNPITRHPSITLTPVPNSVLTWTPQQVESYFASKGLTEDASKFVKHRITGAILLEMDRETLKEIDIISFGPRFEIDKEIRSLRQAVGYSPTSPNSPGTPMSAGAFNANGSIVPSPAGGASMSSIMNTPLSSQGYFAYPQMAQTQPAANSASTLSMPNYTTTPVQTGSAQTVPTQAAPVQAAPAQAAPIQAQAPRSQMAPQPVHQQPTQTSAMPTGYNQQQPHQYQQQPNQVQLEQRQTSSSMHQNHGRNIPAAGASTAAPSSNGYSKSQLPYLSQAQPQLQPQSQPQVESQAEPVPISQKSQFSYHQNSSSGLLRSKSPGSEEEMTGSLGSNFSMRPNGAAMAAAQAAGRGGGHHRRNSSATSRYSVGTNLLRTKTSDEWESTLPTSIEQNETSPTRTHRRNLSRNSEMSSRRNTMPPQDLALFDADGIKTRTHSRTASTDSKKQKRRSSMLSLLSVSPKKITSGSTFTYPGSPKVSTSSNGTSNSTQPSKNGSGSADSAGSENSGSTGSNGKRSSSDNTTFKSIMRPGMIKQKTSAFQEGIKTITAEKAAATAEKSGWMHKRGGTGIGVWSKRFFTLHGTRLSYFTGFKDTKEKGLIDITGHRVVLIKDHDLLVNLSAAGMGAGRHCFKLVPPGPGYKKGVAFTAPKVHYFAVDSAEEAREWQTALMSATIERDESIPVESTCKLPTISLSKAQELMAERLKTKGDIGSLLN